MIEIQMELTLDSAVGCNCLAWKNMLTHQHLSSDKPGNYGMNNHPVLVCTCAYVCACACVFLFFCLVEKVTFVNIDMCDSKYCTGMS